MNDGLQDAAISFDPDGFAIEFSPTPPPATFLKVILDIVTTITGVGSAAVGFIAGTAVGLTNTVAKGLDKGATAVQALIAGGTASGRDVLSS